MKRKNIESQETILLTDTAPKLAPDPVAAPGRKRTFSQTTKNNQIKIYQPMSKHSGYSKTKRQA